MEEEIKQLNIALKSAMDEIEYLKSELRSKDTKIKELEYEILDLRSNDE